LGPVSFEVELTDGRTVRRHQDQIRKRTDESVIPVESEDDDVFISPGVTLPTAVSDSGAGTERTVSSSSPSERVTEQLHRYPSRHHKPPARYADLYQ